MSIKLALNQLCNRYERRNQTDSMTVLVYDDVGAELFRQGSLKLTNGEINLIRRSCSALQTQTFRALIQCRQFIIIVNKSGELIGTGDFNVESRDSEIQSRDIDAGYESSSSVYDEHRDVDVDKPELSHSGLVDETMCRSNVKKTKIKTDAIKGSNINRKLTLAACSAGQYTIIVWTDGQTDLRQSTLAYAKEVRNELHSVLS